jgi:hypothetical protein
MKPGAPTVRGPILGVLLALVVMASCMSGTGPLPIRDTSAPFQTDSLVLQLDSTQVGYMGTLTGGYTNHRASPVYIVNCGGQTGLEFEKLIQDTWTPVWGPFVFDCLSPPIVIMPDSTYRFSLHVFAGYRGTHNYPQFSVDKVEGTYRAVWSEVLGTEPAPGGPPLPPEERRSNVFVIMVR